MVFGVQRALLDESGKDQPQGEGFFFVLFCFFFFFFQGEEFFRQ